MAPSGASVLVTGASGLLGRAVLAEFQKGGWRAVGTAYSRARGSLLRCDLLDEEAVRSLLHQHKVCLSVCLPVCLSACLPVCLPVCLPAKKTVQ